MHPVAQGLPVHAVQLGRLGARATFQNHGQCQNSSNLRAVRAAMAQPAQLRACVLRTCNPEGRAHPMPPLSESAHRIEVQRLWEGPYESTSAGAGIIRNIVPFIGENLSQEIPVIVIMSR